MYVCVCVYVYACMYVYVYVCMYVYMSVPQYMSWGNVRGEMSYSKRGGNCPGGIVLLSSPVLHTSVISLKVTFYKC